MRNFSIELLKQSPSRALRACAALAQTNPSMARELFAAGFVSCWSELDHASQEQLVRSLEAALAAPTIPSEIVTALLNLAEFMEHDDKRLPLDTRTLGALAEKCHAFAKVRPEARAPEDRARSGGGIALGGFGGVSCSVHRSTHIQGSGEECQACGTLGGWCVDGAASLTGH